MKRERQQRAAERILEDVGLTRNLTDVQARPLIDWASAEAARIGGDYAYTDAEVDAAVSAIRRAVLQVAVTVASEHDADRLVLLARQALSRIVTEDDLGFMEVHEGIEPPEDNPLTACPGLSDTARTGRGPSKRFLWQAHRRQLRTRLIVRRRPRR